MLTVLIIYLIIGLIISFFPANFSVTLKENTTYKIIFVIVTTIMWFPFVLKNVYKIWMKAVEKAAKGK